MSLDCRHSINNNVKTCRSEDVLVTKFSLPLLRCWFSLSSTHVQIALALFPAATVWHVVLAWWSAGFSGGFSQGPRQGHGIYPSSSAPLRYAPREPKENTEVLEKTQTEPRLSLTRVQPPTAPPPGVLDRENEQLSMVFCKYVAVFTSDGFILMSEGNVPALQSASVLAFPVLLRFVWESHL